MKNNAGQKLAKPRFRYPRASIRIGINITFFLNFSWHPLDWMTRHPLSSMISFWLLPNELLLTFMHSWMTACMSCMVSVWLSRPGPGRVVLMFYVSFTRCLAVVMSKSIVVVIATQNAWSILSSLACVSCGSLPTTYIPLPSIYILLLSATV